MSELVIDLGKLQHNLHVIRSVCEQHRLELVGVVKSCERAVPVLQLFQRGGVTALGISSPDTARELRPHFGEKPMLVTVPSVLEAEAVVAHCGSSLNSELTTIQALARAAERAGVRHRILLMVDVGDLREGVMPEDARATVRKILDLRSSHLELAGLGTNLACCSGALPSADNTTLLNELAQDIEKSLGYRLDTVSMGGSVMLDWLERHALPPRINQLRVGEAILLGTIPGVARKHAALFDDAFLFKGTVLEIKTKPSMPRGELGTDAFGRKPDFEDKGLRRRALVNLGAVHADPRHLRPVLEHIQFISGNSNYSVFDVTDCSQDLEPGATVEFKPTYSSLVQGLLSPYVHKSYEARAPASERLVTRRRPETPPPVAYQE